MAKSVSLQILENEGKYINEISGQPFEDDLGQPGDEVTSSTASMDGYNHGFYRGPTSMHTQGPATSTSDGSGRQTIERVPS